jgi:hypothetical protein
VEQGGGDGARLQELGYGRNPFPSIPESLCRTLAPDIKLCYYR